VPLLELESLGKSYDGAHGRTEVLRGIDLQVERGEFAAVVGYSGAGKTTLVSLIAGLIPPTSGSLVFAGQPIVRPGPDRGVVFQNYSLLPWLTVFENVYLAVDQVFADWTPRRKRAHAERHVALVNLAAARDKKPAQLSGGMRQRVAVARALAMDPAMLLLDEPFGALDALTRATLQGELGRLCQSTGKTVLLITNDVDEAILLADRIVPLSAGPAACLGPSFVVDIERPRDRTTLNLDPRFKSLRAQVLDYLLASAREKRRRPPERTGRSIEVLEAAR
jgi:nitrate/nitrite transport system ATP-binding protein